MPAPPAEPAGKVHRVCDFCKTVQSAADLYQPLVLGHVGTRTVCKDEDACAARADAKAAADMPVSGRDIPLEKRSPAPHRVRFIALAGTCTRDGQVRFAPGFSIYCLDEPQVSVYARGPFGNPDGYDARDLERVVRQHNGIEDPPPQPVEIIPLKARQIRKGKLIVAAILAVAAIGIAHPGTANASATMRHTVAAVSNCAHVADNAAGEASYTMHLRKDPCHEYVEARIKATAVGFNGFCSANGNPLHNAPRTEVVTVDNSGGGDCADICGGQLELCDIFWWGYRWSVPHGTKGGHGSWHYVRKGHRTPFAELTSVTSRPAVVPPVHAARVAPGLTVTTPQGGVGVQIYAAPHSCSDTPLQVTDSNYAPMFWVNCGGTYSLGDGGGEIGGQVCVTYDLLYCAVDGTPEGTLTLTPTGPDGATGPAETLTAGDIAELRLMVRAHVTFADLRWLAHHGSTP